MKTEGIVSDVPKGSPQAHGQPLRHRRDHGYLPEPVFKGWWNPI